MKKTILLIQPENREINRFRRKQFNNFVQLTMPYLAAFIDENCYEIWLIDEYNQQIPYTRHFDLVAITVNTPNAPHCYCIAGIFRDKGAAIVMGGPHATLLPDEVQEHCDHLLTGECEETWPVFLQDFYLGKPQKRYTSIAPPSLNRLPHPRWDLLKTRSLMMKGAVIATRGCPYHCRYCNLKQIYHDSFRTRPVEEVIREISLIPSRFFVFWDDNFFADKRYALLLIKNLAATGRKWAAQVTLNSCNDAELLRAARKSGCIYLFIGLESFSQASLESAGKTINRPADYREIIRLIHQNGIMIQAGIVFGFDTDTENTFDETLHACEQLGIDGATVSILTPLPQTPVYNDFRKTGRLLDCDWSAYNGKTQVAFEPKQMTPEQLFDGYMRFRRKFYSLSSFIKRMKASRVNLLHNFLINLGYYLALRFPTSTHSNFKR
jgi:radical SAM superfamily enzyme YgiQ (UPF0313 family)